MCAGGCVCVCTHALGLRNQSQRAELSVCQCLLHNPGGAQRKDGVRRWKPETQAPSLFMLYQITLTGPGQTLGRMTLILGHRDEAQASSIRSCILQTLSKPEPGRKTAIRCSTTLHVKCQLPDNTSHTPLPPPGQRGVKPNS